MFADVTTKVTVSKLGNCGERGIIFAYYASLNPNLGVSHVFTVGADNWDHMFTVLTENDLALNKSIGLAALGKTAVIMDGWTEDWWFPNLSRIDRIKQNSWRFETPFALAIRTKIRSKGFQMTPEFKAA